MLVPVLLRDVRRRLGLSIRTASARSAVPRATWAAWESGRTAPTAERLAQALNELGFDLALTRPRDEPPGEEAVRRHLRRSLSERVATALGDELDTVARACSVRPRLLTGATAVGAWVPHVVARGPLPLPPVPADPALVAVHLPVPGCPRAAVAPPAVLHAQGLSERWPGLATAVRLLATADARDVAGRRLPPHRDADEARELADLAYALRWNGRGALPVDVLDGRAWRLDAGVTLDDVLRRHGLPERNRSRRPGAA